MHPLLKTAAAALLATAAFQTLAIGRVADVTVIDRQTGQTLPVYQHRGEYWIAGQPGAKYAIQIRNMSHTRVLAVTSVDGLNVVTGETAQFNQSGYVFNSRQRYGIEGWRKSDLQIAAFVFTDGGDSYAERVGKPRDMGVIGVALFKERPSLVEDAAPIVSSAPSSKRSDSDRRLEKANSGSPPAAQKDSGNAEAAAPMPTSKNAPQSAPPAPTAPAAAAAPAPSMSPNASSAEASSKIMPSPATLPSPKLGTAHGERENSQVSRTNFIRNSATPDEVIRIRYDSHANLVSMGVIPSPRPWYGQAPNAFPGQAGGYVPDPPSQR